jgi:hypothetical protein
LPGDYQLGKFKKQLMSYPNTQRKLRNTPLTSSANTMNNQDKRSEESGQLRSGNTGEMVNSLVDKAKVTRIGF